jgi:hypothetical protein
MTYSAVHNLLRHVILGPGAADHHPALARVGLIEVVWAHPASDLRSGFTARDGRSRRASFAETGEP